MFILIAVLSVLALLWGAVSLLGIVYPHLLTVRDRLLSVLWTSTLAFAFSVTSGLAQTSVVDGSSKEAFDRSMMEMSSALSPEDRRTFSEGAMHLILEGYPLTAGLNGFERLTVLPMAMEAAHMILDGVTFEEIMEAGRAQQEQASSAAPASVPAPEIDPAVAETEARLACVRERVDIASPRTSTDIPRRIVFDATNNLSWPISILVFDYTITSPGRSVPWAEETYSVQISGGIEPGETREVGIQPSTSLFGMPDVLDVVITMRDAWDPENRALVGQPRYYGISHERAEMPCQ